MFIDKAEIYIISGKGGDGSMSFRREKYVPNGGPDGGDGGKGGDVVLTADASVNSLTAFRFNKNFHAENGEPGGAYKRSGKAGMDIVIKVPIGTVVFDNETSHMMFDFIEDGQTFIAARGGRGGQGTQHYATSTRQAPKFAKPGDDAEEKNAGSGTQNYRRCRPDRFPERRQVDVIVPCDERPAENCGLSFHDAIAQSGHGALKNAQEFVMADIPGLIEGANEGMGLGHEFLRHIERTRLLLHVIDASGSEHRDPKQDFDIINNELFSYSPRLKDLRQIIVLNKCDLIEDETALYDLKQYFTQKGYDVFAISAAADQEFGALLDKIVERLAEAPRRLCSSRRKRLRCMRPKPKTLTISISSTAYYFITGPMMKRLLATVNLEDGESAAYFQRVLKNKGIFGALEKMGIKDGETVDINGVEFEYFR
jgi:GTP-binding protein